MYGTLFFDAEDLCKIPTGLPPMGTTNRGGVGCNWRRPVSRCISETVQDRDILTMKG